MNCKNCSSPLDPSFHYCPQCGAQIVRARTTLSKFFKDFFKTLLNFDSSKPIRTFRDLIFKPEKVIVGYIEGLRKKYISPISYLMIAVTLSGFFFFVFLKWFPDQLTPQSAFSGTSSPDVQRLSDINRSIFEYQSILMFLTIPVLAAFSRLVFLKNKTYNYAEHLVINTYAYSHYSIMVTILYLLTIWNQQVFWIIAFLAIVFQFLYFAFTFKRVYRLTLSEITIKSLIFLLIMMPILSMIVLLASFILYQLGAFDTMIEAQNEQALLQAISSAINWTS